MNNPYTITVADVVAYLQTFDPNLPVIESFADFDEDDLAEIEEGEVLFVNMEMVYPAMESVLATGEGRTWRE